MYHADLNLILTFADVQMQAGGSDCGVFYFFFQKKILYDQKLMRDKIISSHQPYIIISH